ncbi:MAG: hypothetical protein NTX57_05810 [Armatimonadetes bacterium]|nr:hypothetical protein [Armatimonadota bacterium]
MNYSTRYQRRRRASWRNPGGKSSAVSFGQLQTLRACGQDETLKKLARATNGVKP